MKMPRSPTRQKPKVAGPKRAAGRPSRYTPELAARICRLIGTGATLSAAAKACGIGLRTVAQWNIERQEFREAYELARETRTLVWAEECIDIVDNAERDYVKNPKTGKLEFNRENVHRAKLRVDERHWQMARLDPRLWGDRQQIEVKNEWTQMTVEQRERRALELLGMLQERADRMRLINQPRPLPPGAVRVGDYIYDPTDGDELAEQEAQRRRQEAQREGSDEE